jgi:hypothetical protein
MQAGERRVATAKAILVGEYVSESVAFTFSLF